MPNSKERQDYIDRRMKEDEPIDKIMGVLCLVGIGGFLLFRSLTDKDHDERDKSIRLPG